MYSASIELDMKKWKKLERKFKNNNKNNLILMLESILISNVKKC